MKNTLQAPLLSMLVFPGLGHVFLKKYALGIGFILSYTYLLLSTFINVYDNAKEAIFNAHNANQTVDISLITQAVIDKQLSHNPNMTFTIYLILFIWIFAAADAYRLAKKLKSTHNN